MFTLQNTTGYTHAECDALNAEFEARIDAEGIERGTEEYREAAKSFADEVSRRG